MDELHDLAQVNVMRLRAPLDSPDLAAFVAAVPRQPVIRAPGGG